jgi:putative PIN family toxin of toxin-antitoxin system
VLVAGISGLKGGNIAPRTDSGRLLRAWFDEDTFTWLISDDILDEYREVLARLRVRRAVIGRVLNLLNEEAEFVPAGAALEISPDPGDQPFCRCAEAGQADFLVTLNPDDFPQDRLTAKVIRPSDSLPSIRPRPSSRARHRHRRIQ